MGLERLSGDRQVDIFAAIKLDNLWKTCSCSNSHLFLWNIPEIEYESRAQDYNFTRLLCFLNSRCPDIHYLIFIPESGQWEELLFRGDPLPHLEGHSMIAHKVGGATDCDQQL